MFIDKLNVIRGKAPAPITGTPPSHLSTGSEAFDLSYILHTYMYQKS